MAFGGGGGKGKPRSDINITPLVDVVLVLLIIFMVMTPILLKQLEVQVPDKVETEVVPQTSDQIVLTISADGAIAINQEPVKRETLEKQVHTLFDERADKTLFFDIDEQANYGFTVEVMSACKNAGVKVLGIATKG
jgi:biopolymer transport protein ExbD